MTRQTKLLVFGGIGAVALCAGIAAALLLLGGDDGDDDKPDGPSAEAIATQCAIDSAGLRRELKFVNDVFAENGLTEAEAVNLRVGVEIEQARWKELAGPCPADLQEALDRAYDEFNTGAQAAATYYACRDKACDNAAEDDLNAAWDSTEFARVQAENALGVTAMNVGDPAYSGTILQEARLTCGLQTRLDDPMAYISIGDEGRSLTMATVDGYVSDELDAANCILDELDTPDSTRGLIGDTTALMGRQTDSFDDLELSWSYHPDDGLGLTVELTEPVPSTSPTD